MVLGPRLLRGAPAGSTPGALTIGSRTSLDSGWRFGGIANGEAPTSPWIPVSLPHAVVPLPLDSWNPAAWQHQWIYQRSLVLPAIPEGARIFLDLDGVLTSNALSVNGQTLTPHQGGYLPFSAELTGIVKPGGNTVTLTVDATWQQVPPDGAAGGASAVDYLEPGGITRGAQLRVVSGTAFIADLYARPVDVLTTPGLQLAATVTTGSAAFSGRLQVTLTPAGGGKPVATTEAQVSAAANASTVVTATISGLSGIQLWSPEQPVLYDVQATLVDGHGRRVDQGSVRTGFREASFQDGGFFLNGSRYLLFGLNRHQIYPYAGMSLPARAQQLDARQLRTELNCNVVRCSHYPQSPAFLDACDELGLMVWEELPGWGYIGDDAWKQLWFQDVTAMVERDRSRASVVIWGVQPNETFPAVADATNAKQLARALDPDRPTSGTQTQWNYADNVQDVYAYDDYTSTTGADGTVSVALHAPIPGKPYLVTESVGALLPPHYFERAHDQTSRQTQAIFHGEAHSQAQDPAQTYAGLIAWCGYDYRSLNGYVDRDVKTPGVMDGFRNPKPGAAVYQSQVAPATRPVIAPSFTWEFGDVSPVTTLGTTALVWSNCDEVRATIGNAAPVSLPRQTTPFPHLAYPPFVLDVSKVDASAEPDLRLDGYVDGRLVVTERYAGSNAGDHLVVQADDASISGDGSDGTRVSIQAVDRYGQPRTYVTDDVVLALEGPGTVEGLVADLSTVVTPSVVQPGGTATLTVTLDHGAIPFPLTGGSGAVWVRGAPGAASPITVRATHPALGDGSATVRVTAAPVQFGTAASGGPGSSALTGVALTLAVPSGLTATAQSATTFGSVEFGQGVTATWSVQAAGDPSTIAGDSIGVTASATLGGRPATLTTTATIPVAVPLRAAYDNTGISDDTAAPTTADFDGVGNSFSLEALAAAGLKGGTSVTFGGATFTWPDIPAGQPDNVVAMGQTIAVSGSGGVIGFLGASASGSNTGTGTVLYTDGTTSSFTLSLPNYFGPTSGEQVAASMAYLNDSNPATNGGVAGKRTQSVGIYYATAALTPGKQVAAVTLPTGGSIPASGRIIGMHLFAIGFG